MMEYTVTTNNVPRPIIYDHELTLKEREEFDYLNWSAIMEGTDSASFFRYKGQLYDLGEFMADYGLMKGSGLPAHLSNWDGYASDSAFSATVVRYADEGESVVVGRVYC
jgi:hypothetical protein